MSQAMTTNERPAAVARALTGAGTAIAMIGMVTGFQISAAVAEQQAQLDAAAVAATTAAPANVRGQAVRVLDASLLPEIVVAAPVADPAASSGTRSSSTAAAPAAPAAPAPAPAQPAPPANGTTAGSGG
jgi:hypothetical protein